MNSANLAYFKTIRIRKADSAWVYHVLEAQEGIVSYSTLPDGPKGEASVLSPDGLSTCLLELTIPAAFRKEVQDVLDDLVRSGVWIQVDKKEELIS